MIDYSLLIGTLKTRNIPQSVLAAGIGISRNAFSNKIQSKTYFTAKEIMDIMSYLNLDLSEVDKYFFVQRVE